MALTDDMGTDVFDGLAELGDLTSVYGRGVDSAQEGNDLEIALVDVGRVEGFLL